MRVNTFLTRLKGLNVKTQTKPIHSGNLNTFLEVYRENLIKCVTQYPDEYVWPISEIERVMDRMENAIVRGSFNKDTRAFKLTCKELKIKHTYKAIKDFISL